MSRIRNQVACAAIVVCTAFAGAVSTSAPAVAAGLSPLRMSSPAAVYDGTQWISYSSPVLTTASQFTACNPSDPVWTKGFAYVPYRVGPSVDQLGACWAGDAYPSGPPSNWAVTSSTSMKSPTMGNINGGWWLFFTAKVSTVYQPGSNHDCIGGAASGSPTGPDYFSRSIPWVCPGTGTLSAFDPEVFHDRKNNLWYLIWAQDIANCGVTIYAQQIDTTNVTLLGTPRALISSTASTLGFDEYTDNSCTGSSSLRHSIGNPSVVRSDGGTLWLTFGANDPNSNNYSEGWASCGTALLSAATCTVQNTAAERYRPQWGASNRTAPGAGSAAPYQSSPSFPGFGALSLAPRDQTLGVPGVVQAVGQLYWNDPSQLHTGTAFRLETTGATPLLVEQEPGINVYGGTGTVGSAITNPSPSGQPAVGAEVPGWNVTAGHTLWSGAIAGDGTVLSNAFDDGGGYSGCVFQPVASTMEFASLQPGKLTSGLPTFAKVPLSTSLPGHTTSTLPNGCPAGASILDAQTLANGDVAFISPNSYIGQDAAVNGVWPALGVLTKSTAGAWQVASGSGWTNQWTGEQLAQTNATVGQTACPNNAPSGQPAQSFCRYLDEMAVFPQSKDLVITQYFGGNPATHLGEAGILVVHLTGPTSGKYTATIKALKAGHDRIIPHPNTPGDPNSYIDLIPRSIYTDPTSTAGDERFAINYDQYDNYKDLPGGPEVNHVGPAVFEEFSYNSSTGVVTQKTAPTTLGDSDPSGKPYQVAFSVYDRSGNLWISQAADFSSGPIGMYRKVNGVRAPGNASNCLYTEGSPEENYTSTVAGKVILGQTCKPDYAFSTSQIGIVFSATPDPTANQMAFVNSHGHVMVIRWRTVGSGLGFDIANAADAGLALLPSRPNVEVHPIGIDSGGRLWSAYRERGNDPMNVSDPQYLFSVDVDRLFSPGPLGLTTVSGQSTIIQAERTTQISTAASNGTWATTNVDANAFASWCVFFPGLETCGADAVSGDGYFLTDVNANGVGSGTTRAYTIDVPSGGTYQVSYQVRTKSSVHTGSIALTAPGASLTTPVDTNGSWVSVAGGSVVLGAGTQTINLAAPSGGGGWELNYVTLTRN